MWIFYDFLPQKTTKNPLLLQRNEFFVVVRRLRYPQTTLFVFYRFNSNGILLTASPPPITSRFTFLTCPLSLAFLLGMPPLPSPWGTSCPLRKALIMLFRDEVSKCISLAFAVPENNVHLTLFEKGGACFPFFLPSPTGGRGTACGG